MGILFSPLTSGEIDPWHVPLPRHVFVISRSPKDVSTIEQEILYSVAVIFDRSNFIPVIAEYTPDPGSLSQRIFTLIRGCGCCVAIYDEHTRAKTMGNIFYEIGIAKLLGKPVYLITNRIEAVPSDVVGDNHILYDPRHQVDFSSEVMKLTENIEDKSDEFANRASILIEHRSVNFELSFELIRISILLSDNTFAKTLLNQLSYKISSRLYNGLPGGMRDYHDKVRALIKSFKRHYRGPCISHRDTRARQLESAV